MRSIIIFSVFSLFVVTMDLYALRGLFHIIPFQPDTKRSFILVFLGLAVLMLGLMVWAVSQFQHMKDPSRYFSVALIMGIFLMVNVPVIFFNVLQLISDIIVLISRIFNGDAEILRKTLLIAGAGIGILFFIGLGMGMIRGRTNVKVFKEDIVISALPGSFNGLKLVQLSDLHLGGFYNQPGHIQNVVDQVNQLEPDLILFTGDMVQNFSEEVDPFVDILNGLKAAIGKYAILGNHDYGYYHRWESDAEEKRNLERVKEQIRLAGFDLLLNEYRTISQHDQSLEIVGVENWGKPPFPKFGDLGRAMKGTDSACVRILMSHDPSHWNMLVRGKEKIQLTLSGHTHGMQFGFEIGRFKWSPSKWTYKNWAGLYHENGQYLYVNRGLGYTGFPGRVGIRPEITLLTLKNH